MKHTLSLARDPWLQTCARCGENPRRRGQRWCNPCFAEYARLHRPAYADLTPEQKHKADCRAYANVYLRRGKLVKPTRCDRCGKRRKIEMHHPDYDRPLFVVWMCRPCHLEHHEDPARLNLARARSAEQDARKRKKHPPRRRAA